MAMSPPALEPLDDVPVLVTGANGFLGRTLVARLLEAGARVRAFVLPHEAVPAVWSGRVEVVRGDVTVREDIARAAVGCRKIFHLAALVGDTGAEALHQRVTVGGTVNACQAAVEQGAQLLVASSVVVYGDRIAQGVCAESTPHGLGQGPYGRAKQAQEQVVGQSVRDHGLDAVLIRPGNIVGPGSGPWLHDVAIELRRGMPVLIGGGHGDAGLVDVANVAGLFVHAARCPAARGGTWLAVDGEGVTWRQYLTELAVMLRARPPRSTPRVVARFGTVVLPPLWRTLRLPGRPPISPEAFNLVANANRFDDSVTRAALGWSPPVGHAQGMRVVAAYVDTMR